MSSVDRALPNVPRDTKDPRARLIRVGANVLTEECFDVLVAGLSPERITTLADRTRRVFYDHFETKEEFVRSILKRAMAPSDEDLFRQATSEEISRALHQTDGDLFDSVRALTALAHAEVIESESRTVLLLAAAMAGGDAEIRHELAQSYEAAEHAGGQVVSGVLESWGLQLRQPWTTDSFTRVIIAIFEGLYVRSRSDVDAIPAELVVLTMLTILPGATQPAGAPMVTTEENLRQFADTLSNSWRENTVAGELDNAYERVLSAFRSEVDERGIRHVTTDSVAKRCGLSPAVILKTFGDTTGLLRAAVTADLPALHREVEFDLGTESLDIGEVLRRHLIRLGSWVVEHRSIALAIISSAAATPSPNPAVELESEVIQALSLPAIEIFSAGIERGTVRPELSVEGLAATATQIVVTGAATNFGFNPNQTLDILVDLLMNGCKTPGR